AELQEMWWAEAAQRDMFPLDDRPLYELIANRGPIGLYADPVITLRPGQGHVPFASAVTGSNRSITVTAFMHRLGDTVSGTILSTGNVQGGYLLYLQGGELVFEHSTLDVTVRCSAPVDRPATDGQRATLELGFRLESLPDRSASVEVLIGGRVVATTG